MKKKQCISSIFLGLIIICLMIPSLHAITRKDALINYVLDCDTGAGFVGAPNGVNPTLESTFQALSILNTNNRLSEIEQEGVIDFVNICKNTDEGFGNTVAAESDIISTFYACWIFNLFNVEIYNTTYEWVADLQNGTEGFSPKVNASVSIDATYFGVETLTLNGTNLQNSNISKWMLERQNNDSGSEGYGGFATDGESSNMWATWAAMATLSRLNNITQVLAEPLASWINASQNLNIYDDDYGAFSNKPAETNYGLLSTYAAIASLKLRGTSYLSRIQLDTALNWLMTLQNDDGGFRVNSLDGDSSLSTTYYAFILLNLLGEQDRLNVDAPWDLGGGLPVWAWILIVIGVAAVAIILIKRYYLD